MRRHFGGHKRERDGHITSWCDEAITPSRQRLDKPRLVSRVIQRLTQPIDGIVEPVVEVHEGVIRTKSLVEFLTRNCFAGILQAHGQDSERLLLHPDLSNVLEKFACAEINLKLPETSRRGEARVIGHRAPLECERVYHPK